MEMYASLKGLQENLNFTAADGLMVGENLLGNPWCLLILLSV